MDRAELTEQIRHYTPANEQEAADREVILAFLAENEDAFERENRIAHMTASAWVVNRERTKVLMVYHRIYDSWSWTGGHADGETDLLAVAVRRRSDHVSLRIYVILHKVDVLDSSEKRLSIFFALTVKDVDLYDGLLWMRL